MVSGIKIIGRSVLEIRGLVQNKSVSRENSSALKLIRTLAGCARCITEIINHAWEPSCMSLRVEVDLQLCINSVYATASDSVRGRPSEEDENQL